MYIQLESDITMSHNYNLDSDSDDEEVEAVAAIAESSTWHLHDIEKVCFIFVLINFHSSNI